MFLELFIILDLFADFIGVALDQTGPLLFQFQEGLSLSFLFLEKGLEFSLFHTGLLLETAFFFVLLLKAGLSQLFILFGADLSLFLLFFAGCALIGFSGTLSSESIQLCLPIIGLLLELPQPLDFLFFLLFDTPKYYNKIYFCSASNSAAFWAFSMLYWAIFSSSSLSLSLLC